MSNVGIIAPNWGNSWLPIYKKLISDSGNDVTHIEPESNLNCTFDVCVHMWARKNKFIESTPYNIMFMRGYEYLDPDHWTKIPWDKIQHLVFCNYRTKNIVDAYFKQNEISTETHIILNAVNTSDWTFKKRSRGFKIGMACHVHPKKNIPLAVQILSMLPPKYELHIAGGVQDRGLLEYIIHMSESLGLKVFLYGHVERSMMDEWWEDKNYCLSTSLHEGNPNNVLEAMAKGIKPVVHAWPGAEDQFDDVFYTASEAAAEILRGRYDSDCYFSQINLKHSLTNYEKIVKLIQKGGH